MQRGAQYTYSDQAIERALTLRCLLNFPLRQTQGFIHSILVLMGLDDLLVVPNYSTLSRRPAHLAVAIPIQSTQEPMHLVADSTGLKVYGEGEWKVRKHGWTTRRTWRELHLGVNADTQEIVAHQLTPAYADGALMAGILFRGEIRNQRVSESYATVTADGWTMSPRWALMQELLNEQYEPKSFFRCKYGAELYSKLSVSAEPSNISQLPPYFS